MKIFIKPINEIVYDEIEIHYEKDLEDGLILIDKIIELSEQYKKLETISHAKIPMEFLMSQNSL